MSGEEVAGLREDIRKLDDKINDNCQKVAVIEERLDNNDQNRKERQDVLDKRLDKIDGGIETIIGRNSAVDNWFAGTKKAAVFISVLAGAGAAILAVLKFIVKII